MSSLARGAVHPFVRMWRSTDPIDSYALNHFTSVAGDAMLAIALADSVFFSLPVGEAKLRVAAYLGITMLPLALAGPLLVPVLDRAGPRRLIAFASAAGRAAIAIYAAPRFDTLVLFPTALALLVLSKVHGITKNGLTIAYAGPGDGLMQANARLGRIAAVGAVLAAPIAFAAIKLGDSTAAIYAAAVVYAASALLTLRLPHPGVQQKQPKQPRPVGRRGAVPALAVPAVGAVGMRAASGFLLFLLAFSLREEEAPVYWFAVLAGAGVVGTFIADVVAPRVPRTTREEAVVIASVSAAGIGAVLAFELFGLPLLTVFALVGGRRDGVRSARLPEPDAAARPAGRAGAGVRALRGDVPARVGGGRVRAGRAVDRLPGGHLDPGGVLRGARRGHGAAGPGASARRRASADAAASALRPALPAVRRKLCATRARRGVARADGGAAWRSGSPWARPTTSPATTRPRSTSTDSRSPSRGSTAQLHAFSDICTHRQCNLSLGGEIDGSTIECECHGSVFDMTTGEVLNGPATEPIATFPVSDEGGDLKIEA